jgi:hypothetical protein
MAEYPSLVVVPTSPHRRLDEAVAQAGKAYDEAMTPAEKAYDEAVAQGLQGLA